MSRVPSAHRARCFNTGRVTIGLAYIAPPRPIRSADEILIQRALLARRDPRKWSDLALYAVCLLAIVVVIYFN